MARPIQYDIIASCGDLGRARHHHRAAVTHMASGCDVQVTRNGLLPKNQSVRVGEGHIADTCNTDRAAKVVCDI